jgi:rhodanese-related sulfurtransferase
MENEIKESMTVDELRQSLNDAPGKYFVIDLMNKEDYALRHIPGSVNIPLEELENRAAEIPKDKTVVAVCNRGLMKTEKAFEQLRKSGYNAVKLTGGNFGWFGINAG